MHLRSDFELLQQQTSVVRPPVHPASGRSPYAHQVVMRSPGRPQIASPVQFRHPGSPFQPVPIRMIPSPLHVVSPHPIHFAGSPQRAFGPLAVSPVRFVSSPHQAVGSGRKRGRSPSESSGSSSGTESGSDLDYSSDESGDQENTAKRVRVEKSPYHANGTKLSKPPSPPKYTGVDLSEEDIDSSDSDYEDEDDDGSVDDLRDFIDFDPKFNRSNISKRVRSDDYGTGDELRDFLLQRASTKPRKWFKALAWNAVGAKLSRHNTPSRSTTPVAR